MARFDVYESAPDGIGYLLDCQADLHSDLTERFVVPLFPMTSIGRPIAHLNPVFDVGGEQVVMMTHFASAVSVRELGQRVTSLAQEHHRIMQAIDFLLAGF